MASNASHLMLFRSPASPRWLSTATVTATATATATATTVPKVKADPLYRKLLALGGTDANVAETLDEWVKEGKSVKKFDIISSVKQLRKFKKYHHAIQLYEWMERSNYKMNNADRVIWIGLLAKTEGVASAEKYFNSLQDSAKTKKTYGVLLNCYCQENMLAKATELFKKMRELNLTSDALNYNNIMSLHLRVGQPEKVHLLTKEMEEKNIPADRYTYNHMMNSYASLKDFDAVEKVMEKMETNRVKHDWFTYGNMATIYVNAGLVDKANASLEKIEKMKNVHDHEIFHTLITLYTRTSNSSGVERAWQSLKLTHPKTSNVSYLIMLLALSKLGDVDGLEKCFREWESGCATYDVRVSNVILESYFNRDLIEEAKLLSENMVKRGAEPNLRTLDLFMNFYLKKCQMDLALKYLETGASKVKPKKNKWFPNEQSVCMFLKYFEKERDTEGAEKFCEIMKKIGRLDCKIYDSLLLTYKAAGKVEPQVRQRIKEDGIEMSFETEKLLHKVCPQ